VEIGFSKSTGADITDNDFANSGSICGDPNCNTAGKLKDVGSGAVAGFGVGTQLASHARGELMLGLRFYQMNTTDASVPTTTFKATVTSLSAMANGYLDFAKSGVSPYLGLGIGVAVNLMGEVTAEQAGASASTDGGNSAGLAAAAMAGVGIPLSAGTVLDIGYRYIA
jgi:opacity protein-like surface antigen